MDTFITAVWVGGLIPAYRHSRAKDFGRFLAVFDAILWPLDMGWHLAQTYCADHKE